MVKRICNEKTLEKYCSHSIEDAGVYVGVDKELSEDRFVAIKVDDYYDGLGLSNEPMAVDFVVSVDCKGNWYNLYVLELKGGKNKNYTTEDIYNKFSTTLDDFLKKRYQSIFCDDSFKYKNVNLYLVATTPRVARKYGTFEKYLEIRAKVNSRDTLNLDAEFSKVFIFRGKRCRIRREIPPNPIICAT